MAAKGRKPPNLRQIKPAEQRACASCEHFAKSRCKLHNWPVKPIHVCDTWEDKTPIVSDRQERVDQANQVALSGVKTVVVSVDPGGAGA